jgi:hypothetical protein
MATKVYKFISVPQKDFFIFASLFENLLKSLIHRHNFIEKVNKNIND